MTEGQKLTVLVVDDAKGIVEIYGRWLGDNYRVQTATDGQAALSMVNDGVDVVLIDRDLPRMSGSTVVEEIRSEGYDPAVILLSSVEPDFDVIDVKFQECLTKPVMRRELVAAVERAGSGEFPDRSNPTVSGPKLTDHADGEQEEETDPRTTRDVVESTAGPGKDRTDDAVDGNDDAAGAINDDEGEEDEDIRTRLQSLQEELDETASKLSERADRRSQEMAERAAQRSGEDGPSADEDTDDEETATDEGTGDEADDDTRVTDDAEIAWEEPPADDAEAADESGETLQERVERLANRVHDLADRNDDESRDVDHTDGDEDGDERGADDGSEDGDADAGDPIPNEDVDSS